MRRWLAVAFGSFLALVLAAGPALACGALISPNGTVQLGRTTTLAAYHDGIEHYVTEFTFQGAGAKFGSIVPLPAAPTKVIKAGRWTLQRLELEVNPPTPERFVALAGSAGQDVSVILRAKIAALDVTVLKGGGFAVGKWARRNGFQLTPDAPAVLDFYGVRSPYFMAVEFNAKRARSLGQQQGQATPVHVVMPTSRPWVPLRILGLGQKTTASIDADVFLLGDRKPALLPKPAGKGSPDGLILERSEPASAQLLRDLGRDRGMGWLPTSGMWLTYLRLHTNAGALTFDLAVDQTGFGRPSPVDAGLVAPSAAIPPGSSNPWALWVGLSVAGAIALLAVSRRRGTRIAS